MPIYEMQCKSCGLKFERLVRKMDEPLPKCGECGGETEIGWSRPSKFQWGKSGGWG